MGFLQGKRQTRGETLDPCRGDAPVGKPKFLLQTGGTGRRQNGRCQGGRYQEGR